MNYLLVMAKTASWATGGQYIFPLGLSYVSASLKNAGFNVFTSNLEFCDNDTFTALTKLIHENEIDVICTSGLSRDYCKVKEVLDVARQIKQDIITIVGGGIISGDPEPAMIALGADIGVIGEGEITICELAYALDNNISYADIPGLICKNEQNSFIVTPKRAEIDDIDSIPYPDFAGFNFSQFMKSTGSAVVYVLACRSCPYSCTFCFHPIGKKYRQRSLDNLFTEIDYLINAYDPKYLRVSDELFAFQKERVFEFCDRISKYNIRWSSTLRVSDVNEDMLRVMHESGCDEICFGVEHVDSTILKSMKKHISLEQIEHALKLANEANIDVVAGLLFGDIAETKQSVETALKWHAENSKYGLMLNMVDIFPGIYLYKYACEQGIIKDKVQFLKEGCPLTNVSGLTDEEYKAVNSIVYEKNMRPIYPPDSFSVINVDSSGSCTIEMTCAKCSTQNSFDINFLYTERINCHACNQCYNVDPFEKAVYLEDVLNQHFKNDEMVAIWGAGEICIKLLDKYSFFQNDNYIIVDYSRTRQDCSVCGKMIYSPKIINERDIKSIIIAVTKRKDEVLSQINSQFPLVERVYLPDIEKTKDGIVPIFIKHRIACYE